MSVMASGGRCRAAPDGANDPAKACSGDRYGKQIDGCAAERTGSMAAVTFNSLSYDSTLHSVRKIAFKTGAAETGCQSHPAIGMPYSERKTTRKIVGAAVCRCEFRRRLTLARLVYGVGVITPD